MALLRRGAAAASSLVRPAASLATAVRAPAPTPVSGAQLVAKLRRHVVVTYGRSQLALPSPAATPPAAPAPRLL